MRKLGTGPYSLIASFLSNGLDDTKQQHLVLYERLRGYLREEEAKRKQRYMHDRLEAYNHGDLDRLPREAVQALLSAFQDVIDGLAPPLFVPVGRKQSRVCTASRLIKPAVRYVLCCKAKLITDRRHNKTIREHYAVQATTVRGWVQEYGKQIEVPKEKDFLTKADFELHLVIIKSCLWASGQQYQKHPTAYSYAAIKRRGDNSTK